MSVYLIFRFIMFYRVLVLVGRIDQEALCTERETKISDLQMQAL